MILAGDLGGTNARLALYTPDGRRVVRQDVIPSHGQKPEAIIKAFLGPRPPKIRAATFGIAGPVVGGRVKTTNLPWELDERALAKKLGIPRVSLINDLVALGLGALISRREKLLLIQGSSLPKKMGATLAIIAAGTGLGECALVWESGSNPAVYPRGHFVPLGTEGGHADFAPRNALEVELRAFLAKRWKGHVSYERVVSGPAFGALYDFFVEVEGVREKPRAAAAIAHAKDRNAMISELGQSGRSVPARRALELFMSLYGAEAGNLALKTLATGGVFIAGAIAGSLAPRLASGSFLQSFSDKGRMKPLLQKIPVAVVLDSKIGLAGAAYHAAGVG